ncbi:tetratricopeptide repeat protein [Deltaproteobacteria bacterium IMCC39524]|nr:tetratricopeptide repeat protein [Deltaproteobacteria bacterium IMCC39524]
MENLFKRLGGRVLLAALLVSALILSLKQIADVDALLHLSMGKLFWTMQGFPDYEVFCYPAKESPFLYTSWLFALGSFLVWKLLGIYGLSLLVVFFTVLTAWVLFRDSGVLSAGDGQAIRAGVVFIALMLAEDRFVFRPEIVLALVFSLVIWILGRHAFNGDRKVLWLLPPICLLWANSHSSITLMFVPFGAFAAYHFSEWILIRRSVDTISRKEKESRLTGLCSFFVLSLLAALFNPNFMDQFLLAQDVMSNSWYKQSIIELQPPRTKELLVIAPVFAASVILSILALRRRAIPYVLISIALLYVSLQAIRFFEFFCLMQAPILARSITVLVPQRWKKLSQGKIITVAAALLIVVLAGMKAGSVAPFERDVISSERFGFGYNLKVDHGKAVNFLQANGISGRVFNVFEDGQSIIWYGWPDLTVFIDGRGAIPEQSLKAYSKAFQDPEEMSRLQAQYGFEVLLFGRNQSMEINPHGMESYFFNPDWSLVYFDKNSYVFLRKKGPYANLVTQNTYRYVIPFAGPGAYEQFFKTNPGYAKGLLNDLMRAATNTPIDKLLMGICYYTIGDNNKAEQVLGPVKRASGIALLYYGHVLKNLGRTQEAKAIYEEGARRYQTQNFHSALSGLMESTEITDLLQQAGARMNRKDYTGARKILLQALELDSRNVAVLANLGYCELDGGNFEEAKKRFDAALSIKPDYDVALYGLGLTGVRQGRPDLAVASFNKYIEVKRSGPYYDKAKAYIEKYAETQ